VIYVLSGHGSTSVEINGKAHNFEWGPRSLFSVPLNATYRHFNASGREPARLAATNNLTYLMNLFRNDGLRPAQRTGMPYFSSNGYAYRTG
jgi:hypothetical protein